MKYMIIVLSCLIAINYSPQNIPFTYDPNQIDGEFIGGVLTEVGSYTVVDVNCTDIHPFTIVGLNAPIGMFVINNPWRVEWTPVAGQEGTHYIVLEATDSPPVPYRPMSSRGTLIIQVEAANQAPVFHPLQDSPIAKLIWPNDYQKPIQELKKQRTIITGMIETIKKQI
jgi:hypothetical protein